MLALGTEGHTKLREASVLVVGAGALGCSCLLYLVGAGIHSITVCDGDNVEASNLHRQVLFAEDDAGRNKAEAAANWLRAKNSGVTVLAMARHCAYSAWTWRLIQSHQLVVDCTDNVGTRYLLNDACYLSGKVLVSAAALGGEGSLTRWGRNGGSCYRCVTPRPTSHEARRQCVDQGVLGPVPGMLGAFQALDVLRLLSNIDDASNKTHLFDGLALRPFSLPGPRRACNLCGKTPSINSLRDSKQWAQSQGFSMDPKKVACGFGSLLPSKVAPLHFENEITAVDLKTAIDSAIPFTLIDVRDSTQFLMCKLAPAVSLPLRQILETPDVASTSLHKMNMEGFIFVLCRRGLDSRVATAALLKLGCSNTCNVAGGLDAWRRCVDPQFPSY